MVAWFEGELTRAATLVEQGLALAQQVGVPHAITIGLGHLGRLAMARGEYVQAATLLGQSLALAREGSEQIHTAFALRALGMVACRQGAFERAEALHREALALYRDCNDRWGIIECLEGLADAACGQSEQLRDEAEATVGFRWAVRLLAAAAAERALRSHPIAPVEREDVGRVTATARIALEPVMHFGL